MITIKSKNRNYAVSFPESLSEIKPEDFISTLNDINLPKYHCIVAMCTEIKLFDLATAISGNAKDTITQVIPLIGKINDCDNEMLKVDVGERIIIDRSSLERGVHLNTRLSIGSVNAMKYINSDADLKKDILSGKFNNSTSNLNKQLAIGSSPVIILVEFKIVPVNSIVAAVKKNVDFVDPFKVADEYLN